MKEKDLLEFLKFIAEEDAQISTIVYFFINTLGYDVTTIKRIVDYGFKNNIFKLGKNDDAENIDWSTSNTITEIYYNDFDHYRKELFVSNPQIPMEFRQFVINDVM